MKIKFELDLEDLLEEDFDYCSETNQLRLKDDCELKETIMNKIVESISSYIRYNCSYSMDKEVKDKVNEIIDNNKQNIIDAVIKNTTKKIMDLKAIKEFRKQLDCEDD